MFYTWSGVPLSYMTASQYKGLCVGIAGLCLWQETVDIPYCENSRAANVISAIKSYCVEILSNQVERSS